VVPLYTRFDYALRSRERFEVDDKVDRVAILGSYTERRGSIVNNELLPLSNYLWGKVNAVSSLCFGKNRDLNYLRYSKVC
jgi:hypothetical protein